MMDERLEKLGKIRTLLANLTNENLDNLPMETLVEMLSIGGWILVDGSLTSNGVYFMPPSKVSKVELVEAKLRLTFNPCALINPTASLEFRGKTVVVDDHILEISLKEIVRAAMSKYGRLVISFGQDYELQFENDLLKDYDLLSRWFARHLNEKYAGKKLKLDAISVGADEVNLRFEDGSIMKIQIHSYDWEENCIAVDGVSAHNLMPLT